MSRPISQSLRRRSSRSLPAIITALVLLAAAVAAGYAGITRLTTGTWPLFLTSLRQALEPLEWNSTTIWSAAIIVAVLGLILLLAALLPGPYTTLRLTEPQARRGDQSEAVITRRALSRLVATHVERIDGVDRSSVRTTGKKLDVHVRTPLHDAGDLATRLESSLITKLQDLGVIPTPKVSVQVSTTRD